MPIFRRKAILTLDTIQIESGGSDQLTITFEIEKGHTAATNKPNTARFSVFNLNPDHRKALIAAGTPSGKGTKAKGVRVRFEAGHEGAISQIFEGDLRIIYTDHLAPDNILHLESGDGDHVIATARINRSWGPGTPVATVLKDVAEALGIGSGNLLSKIQGVALDGWGQVFTQGTVASGSAVKELTRLTKSVGISWSIQDGTLQLLGNGESLAGTAVLVSPETGMVGSPSIDHKGILSVKMLLTPDIFPGRKLKVEASDIQGVFRVEKAKYAGDSSANDWYIDCDCKRA